MEKLKILEVLPETLRQKVIDEVKQLIKDENELKLDQRIENDIKDWAQTNPFSTQQKNQTK